MSSAERGAAHEHGADAARARESVSSQAGPVTAGFGNGATAAMLAGGVGSPAMLAQLAAAGGNQMAAQLVGSGYQSAGLATDDRAEAPATNAVAAAGVDRSVSDTRGPDSSGQGSSGSELSGSELSGSEVMEASGPEAGEMADQELAGGSVAAPARPGERIGSRGHGSVGPGRDRSRPGGPKRPDETTLESMRRSEVSDRDGQTGSQSGTVEEIAHPGRGPPTEAPSEQDASDAVGPDTHETPAADEAGEALKTLPSLEETFPSGQLAGMRAEAASAVGSHHAVMAEAAAAVPETASLLERSRPTPPVAPAQEALASAGAFVASDPGPGGSTGRTAGGAVLAAEITAGVTAAASAVTGAAGASEAQVQQAAAGHAGSARQAAAVHASGLKAVAGGALGRLAAAATGAAGVIAASQVAQSAVLKAWQSKSEAEVRTAHEAASKKVQEGAQKAQTDAAGHFSKTTSTIEQTASAKQAEAAQHPGGDDARAAGAEGAATHLAPQVGDGLRKQSGEIASAQAPAMSKLTEGTSKTVKAIEAHATAVLGGVGHMTSAAEASTSAHAETARSQVASAHSMLAGSVTSASTSAAQAVVSGGELAAANVTSVGHDATGVIRGQAATTISSIHAQGGHLAAQVSGMEFTPARARAAGPAVKAALAKGGTDAASRLGVAGSATLTAMAAGASKASADLGQAAGEAGQAISSGAESGGASLTKGGEDGAGAVKEIADSTVKSGTTAVGSLNSKAGDEASQFAAGASGAATAVGAKLAEAGSKGQSVGAEGVSKVAAAKTEAAGKAQAHAEEEAKKQHEAEAKKPWYDKAVDFVENLAESLINWVKKNWKTLVVIGIGVLVTVVLSAILPGAGTILGAMIIGALAGAVSGGVGAALDGKGLKGILEGAALGGLTGALGGAIGGGVAGALAKSSFMSVAGSVAPTLARTAGIVAMKSAVNTAVGFGMGVASNVITGQPPLKDWETNLATAAILSTAGETVSAIRGEAAAAGASTSHSGGDLPAATTTPAAPPVAEAPVGDVTAGATPTAGDVTAAPTGDVTAAPAVHSEAHGAEAPVTEHAQAPPVHTEAPAAEHAETSTTEHAEAPAPEHAETHTEAPAAGHTDPGGPGHADTGVTDPAPPGARSETAPGSADGAGGSGRAPPVPDSVVGPGSDEVFHAVTSKNIAQSKLNGLDPAQMGPSNRFGSGSFYTSLDPETCFAELAHHGAEANYGIRYEVDPSAVRALDLTDPAVAAQYGYKGGPITPDTQSIGQAARDAGYNAIIVGSERAAGTNFVVIDDFDTVLKPVGVTQLRSTADAPPPVAAPSSMAEVGARYGLSQADVSTLESSGWTPSEVDQYLTEGGNASDFAKPEAVGAPERAEGGPVRGGATTPAEKTGASVEDATREKSEGAPEAGIAGATRLSPAEQATAARLQAQLGDQLTRLAESPHVGADFVGVYNGHEVSFDALGSPEASRYWNQDQFFNSIDQHLLKSNDYTIIDVTGFQPDQVTTVQSYVDSLPSQAQAKIIRIGF